MKNNESIVRSTAKNTDKGNVTDAKKNASDAKETPGKDVTREPKKIKLNADAYSDFAKTFKFKPRVETEEREETGRLTHAERKPRESDGYYNSRAITFRLSALLAKQGKEFDTPQKNANYLIEILNAKLPKERKILRFVYVAKTYQLRFYPANLQKDSFVAIDVSREQKPENVLKLFGLSV